MQMYDGLPIITNKITVEEQQGIPHHLLGIVALDEEPWRVGMFAKKAGQIIQEIRSRGRVPIVVGGTHYYTQSLVFEDSLVTTQEFTEEPELLVHDIEDKFPILGSSTEDMLQVLREVDPVMADRWHPKEKRKIRRSLEIFLTTGTRASDYYAQQQEKKTLRKSQEEENHSPPEQVVDRDSTLLFWVHAESEVLKKRLDSRVDKMIDTGLLDEVKSVHSYLRHLSNTGVSVDRTRGIWVSIGWKEFEPYLNALETATTSPEDLRKLYELSIEQTKAATRQYAKRQVRWIRLNLITALKDENALDKLYLFDGTDVTKWEKDVSNPAIDITAKFLDGDELPPPSELSQAAQQFLAPDEGHKGKPDVWFRRECEICHMTAVTDLQWQIHLKSRKHRGLTKRKERNSGRPEFQVKGDSDATKDTP